MSFEIIAGFPGKGKGARENRLDKRWAVGGSCLQLFKVGAARKHGAVGTGAAQYASVAGNLSEQRGGQRQWTQAGPLGRFWLQSAPVVFR